MARALAVLKVCRVAEAAGVRERHTRVVRAGRGRDPGPGAIPATPSTIRTSAAGLAASLGRADGRSGSDRPFPLSILRIAAERALSVIAGLPDLGRIPGVRFRPRTRRSRRSDADPAAVEHRSAGAGK